MTGRFFVVIWGNNKPFNRNAHIQTPTRTTPIDFGNPLNMRNLRRFSTQRRTSTVISPDDRGSYLQKHVTVSSTSSGRMIPEPPMILLRLLVEAAGPPDPSLFGIEEYRTDRFFEAELARLVIAFSTAVVHILEKRLFIIQRKQQQQQRLDPVLPRRGPISGHFECTHTLFLPDAVGGPYSCFNRHGTFFTYTLHHGDTLCTGLSVWIVLPPPGCRSPTNCSSNPLNSILNTQTLRNTASHAELHERNANT